MTHIHIQADPAVFLLLPFALLILPLRWICAAALAALIHEIAHLACVITLGGRIQEIRIGPRGTVIHAYLPDLAAHCISIAAGPVSSLFLSFFAESYPELAFCGFLQGQYNLLPVLPLDGGRLACHLLNHFAPQKTDFCMEILCWTCILLVLCLMIATVTDEKWTFFGAEVILLFSLIRKTPCKDVGIKVQ